MSTEYDPRPVFDPRKEVETISLHLLELDAKATLTDILLQEMGQITLLPRNRGDVNDLTNK
jgi:hypothetical protein